MLFEYQVLSLQAIVDFYDEEIEYANAYLKPKIDDMLAKYVSDHSGTFSKVSVSDAKKKCVADNAFSFDDGTWIICEHLSLYFNMYSKLDSRIERKMTKLMNDIRFAINSNSTKIYVGKEDAETIEFLFRKETLQSVIDAVELKYG